MKTVNFFKISLIFILICNQSLQAADEIDVSSSYLKNYKMPFASTGNAVNPKTLSDGTYRFQEPANWTLAGNGSILDKTYTGFHIDYSKHGYITISTGWDGFMAQVTNAKMYQTVTLPAGKWKFEIAYGSEVYNDSTIWLAASSGVGIPNIENLPTSAIGYVELSQKNNVKGFTFSTSQSTQLSLGAVCTGSVVTTLGSFMLFQINDNLANYRPLRDSITDCTAIYTANAGNVGTAPGNYPTQAYTAFKAAIDAANAYVAVHNETVQANIDAHTALLKTAKTAFVNSMIMPFKYSTSGNDIWYRIRNSSNRYWLIDPNYQLMYTTDTISNKNNILFKFVQVDATSFRIYSKTVAKTVSFTDGDNFIYAQPGLLDKWQITLSATPGTYLISLMGKSGASQLNSYNSSTPKIFFYNGSTDPNNQWRFVPDSPISDVSNPVVDAAGIFVRKNMIFSRTNAHFEIYTIDGRKLNKNQSLQPGYYIVKTDSGVAKVLIE